MAGSDNVDALAAKIYIFAQKMAKDPVYAATHAGEAAATVAAWVLLNTAMPELARSGPQSTAEKIAALAVKYLSGGQAVSPTPSPGGPVPTPYPSLGAPQFSATEQALLNKIHDPEQRAVQALQMQMQKQALLTTVLTNLANMRHEMLKSVAQNLRG